MQLIAFDERDVDLLSSVASSLGRALRRGVIEDGNGNSDAPIEPGVVLPDAHLRPVSWTAGARAWIDALPSASLFQQWGILPSIVYPAATLART